MLVRDCQPGQEKRRVESGVSMYKEPPKKLHERLVQKLYIAAQA
jgi:hypothetical protein